MPEIPEINNEQLNAETFGVAEQSSAPQSIFVAQEEISPQQLQQTEERHQIRKKANLVGISFLVLPTITFVLGVFIGIATILGNGSWLEDPAIEQALQILLSMLAFTIPFIIPQKLAHNRISDLMSFKRGEKGLFLPMTAFSLAFCAFANIGAASLDNIFSTFGIDFSMPEMSLPKGAFGFILSVLATAVVPAFVEEFAFRGIVLGSLQKYGDGFALLASSICFGIMHSNFEQIPFAFMVGLALGFSVIKTGSLRVAILVHFINNFISVLFSYVPESVPMELQNSIYVLYLMSVLVLALFCIKYTKKDFFTLSKKEEVLITEKEKYKAFFLSPWIMIFMIYNLAEASLLVLTNMLEGL